MTEEIDVRFGRLADPFPGDAIKVLRKGGKDFSYLEWPAAIRRLDEALGPENWEFSLRPWGADALIGALTITLPDGRKVTRENVGGKPAMPGADEDDRVKGAATDCLKRCMMMFGVGLYLHDDAPAPQQQRKPRQEPTQAPTKQAVGGWFDGGDYRRDKPARGSNLPRPRDGKQFYIWLKDVEDRYGWPSLMTEVREAFGPESNYGFSGVYKDWIPEQIEICIRWVAEVCSKTETYKGEFKDILQEQRA